MRVALVNPPTPDGNAVPPLGLLTLAAILEKAGYEVGLFDHQFTDSIEEQLADFRPRAVGFSAVTSSVLGARRLAQKVKQHSPETSVIMGGPHPSVMPEEVTSWPEVDFVIVGEGEIAFPALLDWIGRKGSTDQLDRINNLYYRDSARVISTAKASFLTSEELEKLPLPAYHLLDIDAVATRMRHGVFRKGTRILPYMTSRGCPHLCSFCCGNMGRKIRRKSTATVLHELEHLIERFGLDEVYFEDDNFTAHRESAVEILDAIADRWPGLHIKFANGMRADGVDESMIEKMKRAGCYALSFGIESGSARVLHLMHKNLDLTKAADAIGRAKKMGFLVGGNMIVGYPGEKEEDIWESFAYFQQLKLDSIAIVNLIPFPGTSVRALCEEKGFLTEAARSWDNYYFDVKDPKILIATDVMPEEQLKKVMKKLFLKLYTDPGRVLSLLPNMRVADVIEGIKVVMRKAIARS